MTSVSIVIPCYNGIEYLENLVSSLQSPILEVGAEIIFVDDGSSDGSADAFRKLMPTATVIEQDNAGVAAARNTGAEAASGKFLQLLDADDIILPGKLIAQLQMADQSGADIIYSDWRMAISYPDRIEYEPWNTTPMPTEPVAALMAGWWAPPHAYLIRSEAYKAVGGSDSSLVNAQDFDVLLRMAINGASYQYAPGHFSDYYRYVGTTSLARGPRNQYWSDYDRSLSNAIDELLSMHAFSTERRRAAATKLHTIARGAYQIDRDWYARLKARIFEIDPRFRPTGPVMYTLVARTFGMSTAEKLAQVRRRIVKSG